MDNWNYLKTVIEPKNNYYKFKRDERILEKYNNFSKNIIDIHSYLMKTLFPKNEKITFKINDFPYIVGNNVKHYLLWINPNINNFGFEEAEQIILDIIKNQYVYDVKDYILFRNNTVNKSVDYIEHYHVLLLL
jgi:hypothetical protein